MRERSLTYRVVACGFLFVLTSLFSFGQRDPLMVGVHFKPLFGSRFFNTGPTTATDADNIVEIQLDLNPGTVMGAVIRRSFTDFWAFETGINYVRRNYTLTMRDLENGFSGTTDFRFVSYEIPALGLLYVQLAENAFVNASSGVSFDFFPTDVTTGNPDFSHLTYRRSWIQLGLNANLGFDYRTRKNGTFYIGASYHRPFQDITLTRFIYEKESIPHQVIARMNGNYVNIDFRYFLPIREKTVEENR